MTNKVINDRVYKINSKIKEIEKKLDLLFEIRNKLKSSYDDAIFYGFNSLAKSLNDCLLNNDKINSKLLNDIEKLNHNKLDLINSL